MSVFRRFTGKLAAIPLPATPDAATIKSQARDRLRAAFVDRDAKRQAFKDADATLRRVQDMVNAADAAEAEYEAAAKSASDAARIWATSGARADRKPVEAALHRRATDLHAAMIRARLQADGAKAGLGDVAADRDNAARAFDSAEIALKQRAIDVLVGELEPDIKAIEDAYFALHESRKRVRAAAWFLKRAALHGFINYGSRELLARADAVTPPRNLNDELNAGESDRQYQDVVRADAAPLIAFAQALLKDPNAQGPAQ